ncbi:MAG: RtcB family protein [Fimbriimonadaceae bacterium]|nr:RtcB family protein [Fimbriimonadaceae bacterium]
MKEIENVPVWGDPIDEKAVKQIQTCVRGAFAGALMADHHVGYSMPIGGVVAYWDQISPSGVGYDIACGNKAVRLDIPAKEVVSNISRIMDDIFSQISFGVGRCNDEKVDHELFDDRAWKLPMIRQHKQMASNQLGTVGSGNHYVDLFVDEEDHIWCGVHFGSRGIGHKIASFFTEAGGGADGMFVEPVILHEKSALGEDYLEGMRLAGRYAYAGRDWVCDKVAKILGAKVVEEVHNHHNFAWKETHDGQEVWVVRKGATPAFPGQKGFVGGSMGDISVILEGVESEESKKALYSTVHGAGRVMSRTKAAGRLKKGVRQGGEVTREMMHEWVEKQGVELRGAGTDESPHCYKRLPDVLKHHAPTVKILHTLRPIGVAMAGANEFDPYKD